MARAPVRKRKPKLPRQGLGQRLRNDFLAGLVVVLPIFLTISLVYAVVAFVDDRVVPMVPARYRPDSFENLFGLGLVIFIAFTTLVGALTKGLIGRRLLGLGEEVVDRMPVVRSIYNGVKQIVETVLSPTGSSFKQTCMVEYPRRGIWRLAFVSNEARGEMPEKIGETELLAIFMPSTPNATTGFLMYVPRRDVVVLDMTVEEAAKLVISAGLVSPPVQAPAPPPAEPAPGRSIAPVAKPAV